MMKKVVLTTISLFVYLLSFGQSGFTFQEAELKGVSVNKLDSIYKSAVHADTTQAVFKTPEDQKAMYQAYVKLLEDLGSFLSKNGFQWDEPRRCFNRIYFNENGSIDYFIYDFKMGKSEKELSVDKQNEFNRLLNQFISDYSIELVANRKFAQCSPTTYMPD